MTPEPNVLETMAWYMWVKRQRENMADRCANCGRIKDAHVHYPTLGVRACP